MNRNDEDALPRHGVTGYPSIAFNIKMGQQSRETTELWILTHCYLKTIKRELPENWKLPRGFNEKHISIASSQARSAQKKIDLLNTYFWKHLFKSEILLNYYNLKACDKSLDYSHFPLASEYFSDPCRNCMELEHKRMKAIVEYPRIANLLEYEGFVIIHESHSNASGITLTEKGRQKAEIALGFLSIE